MVLFMSNNSTAGDVLGQLKKDSHGWYCTSHGHSSQQREFHWEAWQNSRNWNKWLVSLRDETSWPWTSWEKYSQDWRMKKFSFCHNSTSFATILTQNISSLWITRNKSQISYSCTEIGSLNSQTSLKFQHIFLYQNRKALNSWWYCSWANTRQRESTEEEKNDSQRRYCSSLGHSFTAERVSFRDMANFRKRKYMTSLVQGPKKLWSCTCQTWTETRDEMWWKLTSAKERRGSEWRLHLRSNSWTRQRMCRE